MGLWGKTVYDLIKPFPERYMSVLAVHRGAKIPCHGRYLVTQVSDRIISEANKTLLVLVWTGP